MSQDLISFESESSEARRAWRAVRWWRAQAEARQFDRNCALAAAVGLLIVLVFVVLRWVP